MFVIKSTKPVIILLFFWKWDPLVFFLFLLLYKHNNNIRECIYIGNIIELL